MKKNNIPEVKNTSAPATAENSKKGAKRRQKHLEKEVRRSKRLYDRLRKSEMTQEQIDEFIKNKDKRLVMCIIYGSYKVQIGTKTVKKNKKEVEIPHYIVGVQAALHVLKEHNIDVTSTGVTHLWVTVNKDQLEEVKNILLPMGRVYAYKWHPGATKKAKDKTPTNNTDDKRKSAKTLRKNKNKDAAYWRPFYAARRKGCVSERIKKYNPALAKKIQEWLNNMAKRDLAKTTRKNRHAHRGGAVTENKRNITLLELKRRKVAKKVGKMMLKKENKAKMDAKRSAMKQTSTKNKKAKEGKLNLAA